MTAELRVYCEARDVDNNVLHRTDVANLVQDPVVGGAPAVGIFLKPTAQQRGNPKAGGPRQLGQAGGASRFRCTTCGAEVLVSEKRLRRIINRCASHGIAELPLSALRC